jgi:hypothetical protein
MDLLEEVGEILHKLKGIKTYAHTSTFANSPDEIVNIEGCIPNESTATERVIGVWKRNCGEIF